MLDVKKKIVCKEQCLTCIKNLQLSVFQDPGISNNQTPGSYLPYDLGVKMDIFIKNDSQQLLIGKVF